MESEGSTEKLKDENGEKRTVEGEEKLERERRGDGVRATSCR